MLLPTFVALCLGALVGLERQVAQEESHGAKDFPGARTFAFTALAGALAVLLSGPLGPWIGPAFFAAIAVFLVLRYQYDAARRDDPGYTTEIASLCTFAIGALAQANQLLVASILTIAMVALLRSKRALHRVGDLLEPADMEVLIRFLVITGIVLPLLPSEPLTALLPMLRPVEVWEVLRPSDVWRMVVLISGVSFVGYVLMRLRAGRSSHVLSGALGGLVSSTATALAYARAGSGAERPRTYEALVVLAASTAFVRMAIELTVVNPRLVAAVAPELATMCAAGLVLGYLFHRPDRETGAVPVYQNPLTLRIALGFAAMYALVLVSVSAARFGFRDAGALTLSGLAAVAGADAPTLSLARLARHGVIETALAARGVLIVAIVTTLAKAGLVLAVGRGAFVRRVAGSLTGIAAVGIGLLWLGL
ncbi:MAG: MgtC/SapB family protein [Myxococcota bacterium]